MSKDCKTFVVRGQKISNFQSGFDHKGRLLFYSKATKKNATLLQ
jgi:hypothetical protein